MPRTAAITHPNAAAHRVGAARLAARLLVGATALSAFLIGGATRWAARRVIYPVSAEPLPDVDAALPFEEDVRPEYVQFAARDGKTLTGWFVPGRDDSPRPWACVLLAYGYGGYKEQMVGYAEMVHRAGFASFMFDMRGSGARRGEAVTLGRKEREDLADALEYVCSRPEIDPARIGVLGVSMGAATALLASDIEPRIKAIVADSSFASLEDMVQPGLRAFVGPKAVWLAPIIVFQAEIMLGMKASDVRPVDSAARLGPDRPLLIIHGADDELTHPDAARKLYDAAAPHGPVEIWMIPGCTHAQGPAVAPYEYTERVNGFLKRALLGDRAQ